MDTSSAYSNKPVQQGDLIIFANGRKEVQSVSESTVTNQESAGNLATVTMTLPRGFSPTFRPGPSPVTLPRMLPMAIPIAYIALTNYLNGPTAVEDIAQILERMGVPSEMLRGPEDRIVFAKPSKKTGKDRGSDIPDWAFGSKPLAGEKPGAYAKRVLDENMGMENGRKGQEQSIINLKNMRNETDNNISDKNDFWIIGWKLNSDRSSSDFYMIFLAGETDVPLMNKGKIVLYSYEGIKNMLAEKGIFYQEFNDMVDLVCDVDRALTIIRKRKVDNNSIILNVLNFLIDGSNALKTKLPKRQKNIIYKFADYLTFNKNIELFFKTKYSRSEVRESIYTLLGLTFGNSTFSDL